MKERPILFQGAMVRSVLAGTKTQTRRVVTPQPDTTHDGQPYWHVGGFRTSWTRRAPGAEPHWGNNPLLCRYGAPGDRLWVREAWAHDARSLEECRAAHEDLMGGMSYGPYYRATETAPDTLHWRPSIHMPRWASRLLLDVTEVRVERLQSISRGDAMAEGCPFPNMAKGPDPRKWYTELWDQINGPGAWATNPWVWAVSFKPISSPAGDTP